jgi:hypothetical protein
MFHQVKSEIIILFFQLLPSQECNYLEASASVGQIMLEKLIRLISDGRFITVNLSQVENVRAWVMSDRVYQAVTDNPRVIHGDLKADQVFVVGNGYRVIDWQCPVVASPELDLVSLLVDQLL